MQKTILEEAVVLFIVATLVLPTIAVMADINEEKNQLNDRMTNPDVNPAQPAQSLVGPVMFSQVPFNGGSGSIYWESDSRLNSKCYEDYWGLTDSICDIHWWGICKDKYSEECYPYNMEFEIIFYTNDGGEPGAPVCVYYLTPPVVYLGPFHDGSSYDLYYWETELTPCCFLPNGWVSIQSISSDNDCYFHWVISPDGNDNGRRNSQTIGQNFAFQITKAGQCNPSVDIEKYVWDGVNAKWLDADTESEAHNMPIGVGAWFNVVIKNDGNVDLYNIVISDDMQDNFKLESINQVPHTYEYTGSWYYTNWYFPGPLSPGSSMEIRILAIIEGPNCVTARNEGYVYVKMCGQTLHDADYAWVHAYKKSKEFNNPFLNWLNSRLYLFPFLQKLFQHFGLLN